MGNAEPPADNWNGSLEGADEVGISTTMRTDASPPAAGRIKRTVARAATVACLLIVGVLALSVGGAELNPLQVLVSGLVVGGLGFKHWLDRVHVENPAIDTDR